MFFFNSIKEFKSMSYSNCSILIFAVFAIICITLLVSRTETYADPKIYEIKQILMEIDPQVASRLNIQASNQSFTEDKRDMYICLRDEKGQYYPDNMLRYVAIHELAHAKSKEVDTHHTGEEFRNNFDQYLKIAENKGIFDPKKGLVEEYCGVKPGDK